MTSDIQIFVMSSSENINRGDVIVVGRIFVTDIRIFAFLRENFVIEHVGLTPLSAEI